MGDFQSIFKRLRIASGLTQTEFAAKIGISRSTIGMYETGARQPDFDTLEKIADFFNVDVDFLIGRSNKTELLPETIGKYYLNEETAQVAQQIFENKELRLLFDTAKDAQPEDIATVHSMLLALKRKERGYDGDDGC